MLWAISWYTQVQHDNCIFTAIKVYGYLSSQFPYTIQVTKHYMYFDFSVGNVAFIYSASAS